jgi:putative transposase
LPELKKIKPKLKHVHSQTLQDVSKRIDLAFKSFFRRCKNGEKPGYPRFKARDRYHSFTYPQYCASFKIKDSKIYMPKVGFVKIKLHRKIEGEVKAAIVKKFPTGKWYIHLVCKSVLKNKLNKNRREIGIDVGLSQFATLSDGTRISNPRFFKQEEKSLSKAQRRLSKQKKRSKERQRARRVVSRVHERIHSKRNEFCHQQARKIINQYGIICVENLNINRMKGKGNTIRLGKAISDVAWGLFLQLLIYKAEEAGRQVIEVNPAYTSQTCHQCRTMKKLELSDRVFACDVCGLRMDRDLNASKNILRLGMQSLATA